MHDAFPSVGESIDVARRASQDFCNLLHVEQGCGRVGNGTQTSSRYAHQ